jgi:hypothetical protein
VTCDELTEGVRELFDRLDADKDGFIGRDELPGPDGRFGRGRPVPDAKSQDNTRAQPRS